MKKSILIAVVSACVGAAVTLLLVPGSAPHAALAAGTPSENGDVNADGRLDIADGIYIINYLLRGGPMPVAIERAPCDSCCPEPPPCDSCCPPAPPLNFLCTYAGVGVTMHWSNPAAYTSIQLTKNGVVLPELGGAEAAYTDTEVTPGSTYSYTLSGSVDGRMTAAVACTITLCAELPACPVSCNTLMLPGKVLLELVSCPPGTFMMGRSPEEQDSHEWEDYRRMVTLTRGFCLGKYEVTKRQWQAVMGTSPWTGRQWVSDDPDSPAVCVTWDEAQAFIAAVNALGQGTFGLPTEAQWEYACRAGTPTRFYWGDDPDYARVGLYAWFSYNTGFIGEGYAHVVGRKFPNAWGLYDMSGNAWEWCQDSFEYQHSSEAVIDPIVTGGGSRVIRGGSFGDNWDLSRSASRSGRDTAPPAPLYRDPDTGFRIARIAPQ